QDRSRGSPEAPAPAVIARICPFPGTLRFPRGKTRPIRTLIRNSTQGYAPAVMPDQPPSLDPTLCRARQDKLRQYLATHDLDGAVFFNRHYIRSLSAYWHAQPLTPASLLVK